MRTNRKGGRLNMNEGYGVQVVRSKLILSCVVMEFTYSM